MFSQGSFSIVVTERLSGTRLDVAVAMQIGACSRSVAGALIREGRIRVQGEIKKPGYRLKAGESISGDIPAPVPIDCAPESITLQILHEDEEIIVIDKPAGMVVHPAPGHSSGTLVNAILYHCPHLSGIGGKVRPGIVHRLDKDTSGVLLVAKTAAAQAHLADQFKNRTLQKTYLALVAGNMESASGSIELSIGRHPVDRKKMSVFSAKSRDAKTLWRVKEVFSAASLLEVEIKTGRTHQIRVHCAALHHPVLGDDVYGPRKADSRLACVTPFIVRQMLHAWKIVFTHPQTGERMQMVSPVPGDMSDILYRLKSLT